MQARQFFLLLIVGMVSMAEVQAEPPETPKQTVTDLYHGVTVAEDYRWLEDWSDPAVKAWSAAQNKYARSVLDELPHVDALRTRITAILSATNPSYSSVTQSGGRFFASKRQPPLQQPFIVTFPGLDKVNAAKTVVDPNAIDPEGLTSIDWYKPSPDGSMVAVSLSNSGSETGNLRIYSTDTGQEVGERISGVNSGTAGGSLAWAGDSKSFYYTRHFQVSPDSNDDHSVYQHVYHHNLGTPASSDRYELGKGFPQIAEIQLSHNHTSGHLLATVQKGDGGEFSHYLRSTDGTWIQFSEFGDRTVQAVFGQHNDLYLVSLAGAPRGQILHCSLEKPGVANAKVVIKESDDTVVTSGEAFWGENTVIPAKDRIYLVYQLGGPSEIRAFDLTGKPLETPSQLAVAAVHGVQLLDDESVLFGNESYLDPDGFYRYDSQTKETLATELMSIAPVSFDDTKVVRSFATSKDGTRIPLNIIIGKDAKLDGSNPCLVYGYGGYGINLQPSFRSLNRVLLDAGFVYVVCNLRGGGEFGEEWHKQGNLTNKQNVFDDFAACAQFMIDNGYTNSQQLATMGGSNGGLLQGAILTQHPQLMKAVVSSVGIYDMLRVELSANGAFNVTEFGTVKNPDQFKSLYGYSPYHRVRNGTAYPAVLFVTGENDPRVDPMQSRKMTARLQAATSSNNPILLRTSANAGHGSGNSLSERIEQAVDIHSFLFKELGVE